MSWQDAPLAPDQKRPAWADAPLDGQARSPSGGTVPEDPRSPGLIDRIRQIGNQGINRMAAGIERGLAAGSQAVGFDAGHDYFAKEAGEHEAVANAPVPGAMTWDQAFHQPANGLLDRMARLGQFAVEQGAGGIPDMTMAVAALPLYIGSRAGTLGQERAVNSGREEATLGDMGAAVPGAVVSGLLERMGGRGMLAVNPADSIAKGAARAAVREGGTEFGQGVVENATGTVGTDVGFDPAQAADEGLAGLVAGAPFGAGVNVGARGAHGLRDWWHARGIDTSAVSDEDLITGSLDGSFHPATGAVDVDAILRQAGADPSQFSSPERAAAAAERASAAFARAAPDLDRMVAITMNVGEGTKGRDSYADGRPIVSPKGAKGRMQVMPGTETDPGFGVTPARDGSPEERARVGRDYLAAMMKRYGNDPAKAWAAYNGGPGRVDRAVAKHGDNWLGAMPEETRNYVKRSVAALGGGTMRTSGAGGERAEGVGEFEDQSARALPTQREIEEGAPSPGMRTGDSSAPFPEVTDDPAGSPGFWEDRAHKVEAAVSEPQPDGEDAEVAQRKAEIAAVPNVRAARLARGTRDELATKLMTDALNAEPGLRQRQDDIWHRAGAIAHLAGSKTIGRIHVAEALSYDPIFEDRFRSPANAPHSASRARPVSDSGIASERATGGPDEAVGMISTQSPATQPIDGDTEHVVTARGREVETRFRVYDSDDLISSDHDGYITDLQPRDRSARASSDAQVAEIAANLDPDQLASSRLASQGAPIIGPDRMVESGNGRVMSVRRAYELHPDKADAYKAMLGRRGFDVSGFKRPVLVRERVGELSPADRLEFVREANERDTMAMSATEQAKADAKSIGDETLKLYRGGAISSRDNAEFVQRFVDEAVGSGDRNAFMQADKTLSQAGIQRVKAALLARAFDNPDLVASIIEDPDTNIKAIGNSLIDAAPSFAALRSRIGAGEVPAEFDIAERIGDMAALISKARSERKPIGDLLAQVDAFSGETNPATEALVRMMFKGDNLSRPRSAADIADGLQFFVEEANKANAGPGLFGDEAPAATPADVLNAARARLDAKAALKDTQGVLGRLWKDDKGALDPQAFARIINGLVDVDGLTRDATRIKQAIGDPKAALQAFTKPMSRILSAAMFTNDARLRSLAARFDSPALTELADMFHARAGSDDATSRTYHEAVARFATTRSQQVFEALQPFLEKPAAIRRISDLLSNPTTTLRATAAEREAAGKIRDLLKDAIDYRKAVGEDIGEVTDGYLPRHYDPDLVAKDPSRFQDLAEQLYRKHGAADPEKAAKAWTGHILDTYAGLDGAIGFARFSSGSGMGSSSARSRAFGKDADILLKDFMQQDLFHLLTSYFTGAARRAEYTRRFGRDGAEGSAERARWVEEHGPEKTKLDVLMDRIKGEVRASGEDPEGVLGIVDAVIGSNLGRFGSTSPFVRRVTGYLHAWNQLGKMDHTQVTSLGELTMGFVRGGGRHGFSFMKDALGQFGRQVVNASPDDAVRWAEAAGVANDAMVTQTLTSRISMDHASAGTQKTMAGFYKAIGLHQFTEGERIAAVKMGRQLLDTWAGDLTSKSVRVRKRASFYMKELGIKDPEAFGKRLRDKPFTQEEVLADKGEAAQFGTALFRLTQQTVMMPTAAEKPTWAAHPVGSLVFSLMGYSYAFKKNVLDRAVRTGRRGIADRDPFLLTPAFGLTILAAFQALNDTYLRPFLFGSGYDFSKETPGEAIMRIADRAGFTAGLSPVINAVKSVRYDRDLGQSLSGPVIGSIADATQKIFVEPFTDRNSPNTNTAERNAAAAFYDTVLEPGMDAVAAARLKGAVRSAAVLATGNREGGVMPADRDAFVDSVAGEKKGASRNR